MDKVQNKEWSGERLETYVFTDTTVEHLHRYSIAVELATGKNVLDIACGEGYGTNLLAETSKHVTGFDLDAQTIAKASSKYNKLNSTFICGNAENLPFEDNIFDLIVSYETIEHLENYKTAFSEIKRVLKPDGLLIISTPNKLNFSDKRSHKNPFHTKEFYEAEFISLIKTKFINYKLLHQQMTYSSFIYSSDTSKTQFYTGSFESIKPYTPESIFLIVFASDIAIPTISNSLFNGENISDRALSEKENSIKNSISYKIGHAILYPFKLIRSRMKK